MSAPQLPSREALRLMIEAEDGRLAGAGHPRERRGALLTISLVALVKGTPRLTPEHLRLASGLYSQLRSEGVARLESLRLTLTEEERLPPLHLEVVDDTGKAS